MVVGKTITTTLVRNEQRRPTQIGKILSLLPSDYRNLINLPTINGIKVSGDMMPKELSLLSSKAEDYVEHTLGVDDDGKYLVAVDENQTATKISVKTVAKTLSLIKTTESIDENMDIGAYRFVEKK